MTTVTTTNTNTFVELELQSYKYSDTGCKITTLPSEPDRAHSLHQSIVSESPNSSRSRSPPSFNDSDDSENSPEYPEGGFRAYSVVLGSFIGLTVTFGSLNSVGVIQTYIASHQLAGVESSTISWIFSIHLWLSFAGGILVGPYFDRKGPFVPLIVGTAMIFGGYMGVANSTEVWQFILSLSICAGMGNTLCITPLVSSVSHWFLVHRGAATGMATIGGSVGGIVIPLMLSSLYSKIGFADTLRVHACFCLGCMVCAILLVRDRLSVVNPRTKESSSASDERSKRKQYLEGAKSFLDFTALKDMKYTFLIAGAFSSELSLVSLLTYFASYAVAQGMGSSSAYTLITIFNATGVLGRLLPGFIADKFGHFNVMVFMLFGVNLATFLLWVPFGANHAVLHAFAAICGFFSSSILSLTPVCLGVITPVQKFGQRYGLLYFFASLSNFLIPAGAAIIGTGTIHNYKLFSVFVSIFAFLGTVCWSISRYFIVGLKLNVKV